MKTLFELILISNVLLALVIAVCEGSLFRGLRPPRRNPRPRAPSWSTCPVPKIKNGTVRLQRGGRMVAFSCSDGFEIHGAMSIICASGRWKQDIPICIKTGCPHPQRRSNGLVMLDEKKQKSMLFCQEGYVAAGSSISFCNGNTWDRELGECRLDVGHSKICDFESVSICGWTQDDGNDFHWVRKNGWNSFEKLEYGPKHDHTKGIPLEGHYMIAEATNSRTTQRSRIFSPIHNQTDSENACFRFFYHMYGHKVGRLRAIVKNINETMDEIADKPKNILFEKENSQGNQWNEAVFMIEPTKADFQIVFEATGSRGLISDIAIDDVSLMKDSECLKYLNPEITTTESDGVYDMQSCANRCLETNSVRGNSADTFHQDGHLIEKCDCHQNCLDTSTCCWDYVATCIESISQPPDSDTTISTFDDSSMGFTTIELEVTTPVRTIIKSTTQKPAVATTKSSSTTSTTERSTSSTSSTSTTSSTFTASTTLKTTIESTVTRAKQVVNTLSTIPLWTKTKTLNMQNTTTILQNTTVTQSKIDEITTKPVKKTTLTTVSSKKIFSPTQVPKSTIGHRTTSKTVSKITTLVPSRTISASIQAINHFVMQKETRTAAWMTPSHTNPKFVTSTDATSKAILMYSKHSDQRISNGKIGWISTIVLICVLSMLMLTGWKYFSAQKWNQFNSQQIEYKSNYHSDEIEESLVRSNSFVIDDSFSETLIDKDEIKKCSKSKKVSTDKIKTNATVPHKSKKVSNRLAKSCDQYSEKRCLTIDDEQFDFSPQMHK